MGARKQQNVDSLFRPQRLGEGETCNARHAKGKANDREVSLSWRAGGQPDGQAGCHPGIATDILEPIVAMESFRGYNLQQDFWHVC